MWEKFTNNTGQYMFKGYAGLSPTVSQQRQKRWNIGMALVMF